MGIIRENISFKRGQKPEDALNLGLQNIANDVSEEDFENILQVLRHEYTPDNQEIGELSNLFKDQLEWDNNIEFDVYEIRGKSGQKNHILDLMIEYIHKNKKGRYAYSDSNFQDSWSIIFSKLKFPNVRTMEELFPKLNKTNTNESIQFQRGQDVKKSLGIGIKEINRDLETMATNFMEHFSELEFVEDDISIRRRIIGSYKVTKKVDLYPIVLRFIFNAKPGVKSKIQRLSQSKFKQWIWQNTPFMLKASRSGSAFVNKNAPSGYGYSHILYLDDKE